MDQYYGLNATTRNELYGPPMSDVEQGQSSMNPRTPGSNPRTPGNHMVNQATTTPGGGAGVIDDYSFSNVNLSSPNGVVGSPGGVVSPGVQQPQRGLSSDGQDVHRGGQAAARRRCGSSSPARCRTS